ncbi:MAG: hypothetical protein ACKPAD_02210, partial [Bacteroidota bacterium]
FDFKTYFKELRIGNFFNGSVVRTGGGVALEDVQNRSKLTRAIDPIQGIYLFPLCNYTTGALTTSQYLPLTISNLSGGLAQVTISTYPTPSTNLPWPVTPVSVANLSSVIGLSPDNRDATADRFWNISSTTPLSDNITFKYNPVELPTLAPYNDPAQLKAQNYDDNVEKWQSYLPGQTAGNYFVTVPSVPIDFTWALSSTPSPLPVELLYFNAIATSKNQVSLNWATATETNSWKFSVERSDGFSPFEKILEVDAAGNSITNIEYSTIDIKPLKGTSYYRLRETDLDGTEQLSNIVRVDFSDFNPKNNLFVYPNPALNEVFVKHPIQSGLLELIGFDGSILKTILLKDSDSMAIVPLNDLAK